MWLALELNLHYGVNKKAAQNWIKQGLFLPLLDGLDEVAEKQRIVCVEAINAYRETQPPSTPLVVCCRWAEYQALPQLRLSSAIRAEPLTQPQIDGFLKQAGSRLAGVRAVVKDDPSLYELLEIPLMLSITALTFADQPATALRRTLPPGQRRAEMFDAFITRQFQPPPIGRGVDERYGKQKTLRWLRWLAARMKQRDQSVYWMEFMQADWLQQQQLKRVTKILNVLLIGLIMGPLIGLLGGLAGGLITGMLVGLVGGLVIGLLTELFSLSSSHLPERASIQWKKLRSISFLIQTLRSKLIIELVLVGGLAEGLAAGLTIKLAGEQATGQLFVQGGGLAIGLTIGLVAAVVFGLVVNIIEYSTIDLRIRPNQGIKNATTATLINGLVAGLATGLTAGLAAGLVATLFYGLFYGLAGGVIMGLAGGVIMGLAGGPIIILFTDGKAVPRHYVLRLVLFLSGTFPWNIARFLDSCAQRRLVQRVGGGWRFPHNLIRDHVAELDVERLIKESKD